MNQQVAIITGAASGIGNGIAQRLGSEGCKVIIFDFDSKGGNKASKDLIDQGVEAYFFDTDVTNEKSVLKISRELLVLYSLNFATHLAGSQYWT